MIKNDADEGNGKDTANWKSHVKEIIDFDSLVRIAEYCFVLWADGGNKEIDAGHLDDCEHADEDEPWGSDLLKDGSIMKNTPDPRSNVLSLFSLELLISLDGAKE